MAELITIKGSKDILIFHFNINAAGLEELSGALAQKLQNNQGFFAGARYLIAPENGFSADEAAVLENILNGHGLKKAIKAQQPKPHKEKPQLYGEKVYDPAGGGSELFLGSLRSGASVSVKGNAVVIGDVNAGAQISASGHIVVMGSCRGILHAGCMGDRSAFVVAYRLQPLQVKIADILFVPADKNWPLKPQIVSCLNDEIVINDYTSNYHKILSSSAT